MKNKNKLQWFKQIGLNPYFILTLLFSIWMFFFDCQNIYAQYRLYQSWKKLKSDIIYYNFKIQQVKEAKIALVDNVDYLEKFAREEYYMKRNMEDLYVIIPE